MAKKTLLSEGHIRKFMKLAAIEPLTENFLAEAEDEDVMEEAEEVETEEETEEVEAEVEAPEGEEGDMGMEMDAEMGEEGEELEGEEAIKAALTQLIDAIKAAPETEITVDEGYAMEEMADSMEEEAMYEELNESVQVVDTQAIVKEVSRRVAQRLIEESKQEQLAEALAAKIAAKLG